MGDVYLDHAATTPLWPEALEAMLPFLGEQFANPSSGHRAARRVRRALDEAREQLAVELGCAPGEIVFTSGGTESDNLAVKGVAAATHGAVVVSAVEHHAVLNAGARVGARVAPVDANGVIDLDAMAGTLGRDAVLVSVMAANNETGVVEPVEAVATRARAVAPAVLVHTDAVQAYPYLVASHWAAADLVSFSAHKFGGPKGVGALVVRYPAREHLGPLLDGGAQENELRAGTENVAGIIGMAAAAAAARRHADVAAVAARRDRLAAGITEALPGVSETAASAPRLPSICHLVFRDVEAEELLLLLDEAGVAASAGAACAAGAIEPSHVLLAMGRPKEEATRAVRFSLSSSTTDEEIDRAVTTVVACHHRLTRSE